MQKPARQQGLNTQVNTRAFLSLFGHRPRQCRARGLMQKPARQQGLNTQVNTRAFLSLPGLDRPRRNAEAPRAMQKPARQRGLNAQLNTGTRLKNHTRALLPRELRVDPII